MFAVILKLPGNRQITIGNYLRLEDARVEATLFAFVRPLRPEAVVVLSPDGIEVYRRML